MDFYDKHFDKTLKNGNIDSNLYEEFNVKRGLRNANGTGVLVGLTKVSDVYGYSVENNKKVDQDGHLYYRGIDLYELTKDNTYYGFEKTCYLLLFGELPDEDNFNDFKKEISDNYLLPEYFLENIILKNVSKSVMNHIARSVLSLYTMDDDADNINPIDILKKGINLIGKMPSLICYSYQAKRHYIDNETLHIRRPSKDLSIAENILFMSRKDGKYSALEAQTLDLSLTVHADHGGGNNSTFTNIVVSSTNTDIYSTISSGIGALKGPRHGGANQEVLDMMTYIIDDITLDATNEQISVVINKILDKKYFDNSGLIYGIGHAIYTKSDPRCRLLKAKCQELSLINNDRNFQFYDRFEQIATAILKERKGNTYCANVDFYSGLTYSILGIPRDLFIPIFACARICGWVSHIIENKLYCNKIIRPAAKYVGDL